MGFHPEKLVVTDSYDEKITRSAIEAARRKFTPEFMNRIDKTVVFKTLRDEHLEEILEIELGMVQQRILMATGVNQFVFTCTPGAKAYLLREGTDPRYGARHLKRALERSIVHPLASLVATAQVKLGDFIKIDVATNGTFTFTKEGENTTVPGSSYKRYGVAAASSAAPVLDRRENDRIETTHFYGRVNKDTFLPKP
jgi:ATP-dependent Clp protease ATP-binding subunit ClpA